MPLTAEDLLDRPKMVELLAAQGPLFEPGSNSGYQAISHGYLVGEVIRRVTGQTSGSSSWPTWPACGTTRARWR
ncbi:serine hydrolase [Kutzneria sp. NPDC051319]|uniref:serine hydrolase n=1 Tax=Kutzneria sp. NPDC051319 TaxID=3155047 RepID=UPI003415D1B7